MARRSGNSTLPPPLEMACLGALWTMREGTVRDVSAALASRQSFAYTTVMTLLERLVKRGHLTRRKAGRSFVYTPVRDPEELREIAIGELARDYFSGSRAALRQWLDRTETSTPQAAPAESEPIDTALL
ncbi:MAG: BlaI/MecI/CopY family transcriptional regulator [Acidobacteria bacterium]|nr:BlaI/MecI/CopY family transcriptional regulator [Acidobacteriota bacterium]